MTRALEVNPNGGEAALSQLTATPTPRPTTITCIVQPGDTVFSIARRYGTSVDAIATANGLVNYNIRIGQQLIIPLP